MWIVITCILVVWLCVAGYLLKVAVDNDSALAGISALFILIAPMIYAAQNDAEKGPCVQYETQMHYNAATKSMMPAKVCVLRGEWTEE